MDDFTLVVVCMSLVSLTTIAYMLHRRKTSSPATHLPPSPPKLPVIGHLHLLTDLRHQSFARLANQYGPIIYLQLGHIPTIVVSSAQLAELVLKTHDHIFLNRPQASSENYPPFGTKGDVTFSKYGPYWKQARKICINELLSPKRVNSFQLIRDEEVTRLVQDVATRSGLETNLSELLFRLGKDMLSRVVFGKRLAANSSVDTLVRILGETLGLPSGFCIGDFYPKFEWVDSLTGMRRRLIKNNKQMSEVFDDIINEHSNKRPEPGKEDFVDDLLRVQQQDLEVPITFDNLKAIILDMFVAGSDTTPTTIEWVMTELVLHPEVMKKAQDEIRGIVESKGEVEESHLHHFHYLKCVIKESMRLHPGGPLLVPRESMQKCTLNGYDVPEKTQVLINTYAIGRDPNSWEDPLVYDPERFVGKDIDFKGLDFRFLPFGSGRRGCPGITFGLAIVELALARLLYHFNWEFPSGIRPSDIDLEERPGLVLGKKIAVKLVATKNKNQAT